MDIDRAHVGLEIVLRCARQHCLQRLAGRQGPMGFKIFLGRIGIERGFEDKGIGGADRLVDPLVAPREIGRQQVDRAEEIDRARLAVHGPQRRVRLQRRGFR